MPLRAHRYTPLLALGEEPERQQVTPVLTLIPNCFFDAPFTLTSSRANLEDDRKKKSQDEAEKVDLKCAKMNQEKSDSEASATGEQDDACKGRCISAAEVRPWVALPTLFVIL